MKRFFIFIGIVILLLAAFVLIAGLFISKNFHYEKKITINAPKEEIYKNVSHFSNFEQWDPWEAKDPKMVRTITGIDGTVGATYSWKGNKNVGSGTQTYTSLKPSDEVRLDLNFKEPFESKAKVYYTLVQKGNAVEVTWGFDSQFPYPFNAISALFMNMNNELDKDFSTGLSNLKKLSENNTTRTAELLFKHNNTLN